MRPHHVVASSLALATTVVVAGLITAVAGGSTTVAAAVPSTFRAQSLTWTTPRRGWVLGTVPCGKALCSEVIGTSTGSAWAEIGRVPDRIARSGERGVSEIRMANRHDGWAFGPDLFHTTDGGQSWHPEPVPGGGKQLLALAATPRVAYALVSPCRVGSTCHRDVTVWRTLRLAQPAWHRLALTLPPNTTFNEFPAMVAISHRTVYLLDPQPAPTPDAFYASVGGGSFTPRRVPCHKKQDGSLAAVAPSSASDVALLCVVNPGFGAAGKPVFRSTDAGKSDHSAGQTPLLGLTGLLAASTNGTLAVASYGAKGSFVYLNTGGTKWTTPLSKPLDGGAGWNDIAFSSPTAGWVVYGPADFSNLGIVYHTSDGGMTWTRYRFSAHH